MDEYRIRGLLKRIDDLRREAEELLPKPEPKPLPKPEPSRLPRSCRVVPRLRPRRR